MKKKECDMWLNETMYVHIQVEMSDPKNKDFLIDYMYIYIHILKLPVHNRA